ncbi:MAG: Kelch repeat-containing protein [Nitrososphaerales archaeon]
MIKGRSIRDSHIAKSARSRVLLLLPLVIVILVSLSINSFMFASAESVGTWTSTTAYGGGAIYVQSCAIYAGYIYCVGGASSSGATSAVYYAPLTSTGVGAWTSTTAYGGGTIYEQSCAIYSGYIYCVGGHGSSGVTSAVYYAPLTSTGVGAWTSTTAYGGGTIYLHSCAIYSGYIYCVGGASSSGATSAVYYAPINFGSITTTTTASTRASSTTTTTVPTTTTETATSTITNTATATATATSSTTTTATDTATTTSTLSTTLISSFSTTETNTATQTSTILTTTTPQPVTSTTTLTQTSSTTQTATSSTTLTTINTQTSTRSIILQQTTTETQTSTPPLASTTLTQTQTSTETATSTVNVPTTLATTATQLQTATLQVTTTASPATTNLALLVEAASSGGTPIANDVVNLSSTQLNYFSSMTTNASGQVLFTGLNAGQYKVTSIVNHTLITTPLTLAGNTTVVLDPPSSTTAGHTTTTISVELILALIIAIGSGAVIAFRKQKSKI